MVKLTPELIARSSSGLTLRARNETLLHYLRRLTHVFLEGKSLEDVGTDLGNCHNLEVLYLYDNSLTKIPDLHCNKHLSALYLQNNDIHRMENLTSMPQLTKLYLSGNHITKLEGLSGLYNLRELYIDNQKLPVGEKLQFEPESLSTIANSLQVLGVTGNGLDSLHELEPLTQLCQLFATNNSLSDIAELVELLGSAWRKLQTLDLRSNPICRHRRYRDRVIIMSSSLGTLDGKVITHIERQFLQNWRAARTGIVVPAVEHGQVLSPAGEPDMSLVSYNKFGSRQRFYYDSSKETVRECRTPRAAAIVPSLVQLPELPAQAFQKSLSRSVSHPAYRSLVSSKEQTAKNNRFLNCSGITWWDKTNRSASFHIG